MDYQRPSFPQLGKELLVEGALEIGSAAAGAHAQTNGSLDHPDVTQSPRDK